MKKKQEIRWKKSVGNNRYNGQNIGLRYVLGSGNLLLMVCTLLFFASAYQMQCDVYDWGSFDPGSFFGILLLSALVSEIMELRSTLGKTAGRLLSLGVLLTGSLGLGLYLRFTEGGEKVLSGLLAMGSRYARDWNAYYGTGLLVSGGNVAYCKAAADFMLLVLCFFFVWGAKLTKKILLPVAAPLLIFAAELLVGDAPGVWGIFGTFAGILISGIGGFSEPELAPAPDRHDRKKESVCCWYRLAAGAGILLFCIGVKMLGTRHAEIAAETYYEKLQNLKTDVVDTVSDWDLWSGLNVSEKWEKWTEALFGKQDAVKAELSNENPNLGEDEILKLWFAEKPSAHVYLKGFFADAYEEGVWSGDDRAFVKACEKAGFDSVLVKNELVALGTEKLRMLAEAEAFAQCEESVEANVFYYNSRGKNAYLPYFSEALDKQVLVDGDARYVKKAGTEQLSFSLWKYGGEYVLHLLSFLTTEEKSWESWYEDFVERQYLSVPSYVPTAKQLAEELVQSGAESGVLTEAGLPSETMKVNQTRLNKAYLVAEWLQKNTEYSLEPGELPDGIDVTEYFIKTGRKGYCMHYASAATIILRAMGVPARYVSGYIAAKSSFIQRTDGYEAVVLEKNAHAWVEIYLHGIGWVPIEVTKGYVGELSGGSVIVRYPTASAELLVGLTTPTPKPETSNIPSSIPEDDVQQSASPSQAATATLTPTPKPESEKGGASQKGDAESPSGNGLNKEEKNTKHFYVEAVTVIFVLLFFLVMKLVALPLLRKGKEWKWRFESRRIRRRLQRLGNRRGINLLNRKLYRKLRRTGKIVKSNLTDEEYETVLEKCGKEVTFAERKRYVRLVKEAAFSYNEFSSEDVVFCFEVYRRVVYRL